MKLILLSQSLQPSLVSSLHADGHVIFITTDDFDVATTEIFRVRPHAVLIYGQPRDAFVVRASEFVSILPDQCLVVHQPGDTSEILKGQLDKIRDQIAKTKHSPSVTQRMMFFDRAYVGHVDARKRNQPKPEHAALLAEQDKFLILLEQASLKQGTARHYRNEVEEWEKDDTREVAYAVLHRSFKSVPQAQEQIGRWLAVFAHYTPEADLCYLPPPVDPISCVRWIFDGSSPETRYAFACADQLQFIDSIRDPIRSLLDHRFVPGDDVLMTHASLALFGSCMLVRDVAEAHLLVMERYLGGNTQKLLLHVQERTGRREHQVFCEFWSLPLLCEFPQLLAKTVNDFHRGRRAAIKIVAPQFLDILAKSQSTQA